MNRKWISFKNDVIASVIVFLVAIPLCLGIALASGASFFSGIITGIIGGIVVGFFSDSQVSVSGPAAGMIAIVLSSTAVLGNFQTFLLALVFAGLLQILIGSLRAGFIADYVPSNVIQGLLAAIGILIIIKKLPLAFGFSSNAKQVAASIVTAQGNFSLTPLLHLIHKISIPATFISIITLIILLFWNKIPSKFFQKIPAAIMAVIISVLVNFLFSKFLPSLALLNSHLVNIPVTEGLNGLFAQLLHPNFSAWTHVNIYVYGFIIAIVASLETLLNLEAAEKLDPHHRYCSRNKELIAQGVGNTLSGLIGGLPITSVIVRTSVNIHAGNRTKLSAILHGGLLLISIVFIPAWLNQIPLATLATILIATGYKLASFALFKRMYSIGKMYFTAFIITVVAIVFTNLLLGVLIGLGVGLFFILYQNSRYQFLHVKEKHTSGDVLRLVLPQQLSFLNKAAIVNALKKIPKNSKVLLDANHTNYIDQDILEIIKEFRDYQAPDKNIALNILGLEPQYDLSNQINFITATTLDVQSRLTPTEILQVLKEGNQRFINNTPIHKDFKRQIKATSDAQHPIAVVLSCIDSRVPVENVFDLNLGDVFVARIAGNIINTDILASIEFACEIAGAKLIVVLGHKRCGAITAACEDIQLGHLSFLLSKIKPAIAVSRESSGLLLHQDIINFVDHVACTHVDLVQKQLFKDSKILHDLLVSQKIGLVGAIYDITTGKVTFDVSEATHDAIQSPTPVNY
ncbi:bifunctional SulP family inorganic anion transporter/carbonic anhydrase [Candidiatus Paracoxiella cheracis]|uniref:bifunctional SulP family inorganic anion transporter/carbonic anhydrase n=1 Tax=Candidiatus Paracoxiella cheracis TaxID=3405120 RepID=UPI003BF57141